MMLQIIDTFEAVKGQTQKKIAAMKQSPTCWKEVLPCNYGTIENTELRKARKPRKNSEFSVFSNKPPNISKTRKTRNFSEVSGSAFSTIPPNISKTRTSRNFSEVSVFSKFRGFNRKHGNFPYIFL